VSRVCTICVHPEQAAINQALVHGAASNRRIASQYGVSEIAIRRHKAGHLPRRLAQAQEAEDMADADSLLEQVSALHRRALAILGHAEVEGEHKLALAAIREARSNLELLGRLMGELNEQTTINILMAPEWLATRAALKRALEPYVEARVAVAAALVALEEAQHNGHSD
jgi:hypothetical protein